MSGWPSLSPNDPTGRLAQFGFGFHPEVERAGVGVEPFRAGSRVAATSSVPQLFEPIARAFLLCYSVACCSGKGGFFMCTTHHIHVAREARQHGIDLLGRVCCSYILRSTRCHYYREFNYSELLRAIMS